MARTRRSISWLHVRPRTVHNSRSVGTLDVFGDVKYRASAMAIEELETVYDSNTDTEIPELSTNINRDNVWNSPGLNDEGVALAAKHFGLNDLQIPSPQSTFWRYCRLLMHPYHVCLIIAGVLLLIAYGLEQRSQENLALFFVLWILVAVTSCLGMESGTPNRLSSKFRALRPSHARVIRNGEEAVVVADTLYPGDLVRLIKGESIPADIRILSVNADQSFTVSERTLTGNINPLVKVSTVMPIVLPARKCPNIVLQGSTVLSGEALGVVVGTGRRTVLGRVYDIVGNKLAFEAPIEGDLQRMITELTAWTVIWALVVFLIGVISDKTVRQHTLLFTAGVLVACIPEGMILTIMISLAWTSAKMKKQGLIVPNLETAETLGMIDTLCCDRTVFTSNKLKVGEVWYSGNCVTDFNIRDAGLRVLVDTVTLSSKAQWVVNDRTRSANQVARNDPPEVHGDYIDVACLRFCDELYKSIGTCSARVRESNPCVGEVPFLPRNNWTLQVHHSRNKREDRGFLKGAFERIRKMSDYILIDGEEVPMQQSHILEITTSANAMAKRGFRILGLAQLVLPTEHYPPSVDRTKENSNYSSIETDDAESLFRDDNVRIVFVGLLGIDDPPVPGVANAVSRCRRAGIKIVVTTGEHGWCTESFGRQIGLITGVTTEQFLEKKFGWHTVQSWTYDDFVREEADLTPEEQQQISARIIPGHIIERWNLVNMDENWKRAIETDEVIFSRCTPAQKKIIAHHYKLTGHVVGVTGSDLHDGAALKEADVGFCCGQGIVQAIREAADVICLENNFVAMVRGIAEGRTIFDNLKKSIAYCLTSNMPQLIAFLLFAIIRIPAPLTVTLCLCIDIGTDFFAGLSLGLENQEQDLMEQDPPAPTDGVYNRNVLQWSYFQIGIIESLGAIYTFFVVMHAEGYPAQDLWFSAWRNFHLNAAPFNHYSVVENIHALKHAQTAYFGAIVIQQLAVHLIVRTRRQSLFASQNSWATHFSWVLSMVLTTFIVYTPVVHNIFGTTYLPFLYWLPSIPWALFIIEYEELRKLLLRNVSNISLQRIISW